MLSQLILLLIYQLLNNISGVESFKYGFCPNKEQSIKPQTEFRIGAFYRNGSNYVTIERIKAVQLSPISVKNDVPLVKRTFDTLAASSLKQAAFYHNNKQLLSYFDHKCFNDQLGDCSPYIPPPRAPGFITYINGIDQNPETNLTTFTFYSPPYHYVATWRTGDELPKLTYSQTFIDRNLLNRDFAFAANVNNTDYFYITWLAEDSEGYQFYSKQPIDLKDNLPIIDLTRYNYLPITHWIGCPQDLCLDATIDAVDLDSYGNFTIYRDFYQFETMSTILSEVHIIDTIVHATTKIRFKNGNMWTLEFSGAYVTLTNDNTDEDTSLAMRDIFRELKDENTIDASFFDVRTYKLYLVVKSMVYIYKLDHIAEPPRAIDISFILEEKIQLEHLIPGIWSQIDAATLDYQGRGHLYIFKNDFYVKYQIIDSPNGRSIILNKDSDWSLGNLWTCDHSHYEETMKPLFGISTLKQFKNKFAKVRQVPKIDLQSFQAAVRELEELKRRTTESTTTIKNKESNSIKLPPITIALIVAGVILLVIVIGFLICIFCRKKKKRTLMKLQLPKDENVQEKKRKKKTNPVRLDSFMFLEQEMLKKNAKKSNSSKTRSKV